VSQSQPFPGRSLDEWRQEDRPAGAELETEPKELETEPKELETGPRELETEPKELETEPKELVPSPAGWKHFGLNPGADQLQSY